jgi:AraC-like DNA-binding protein
MALENARRGFCSLELIHAQLFRLLATVCRRHKGKLLALASEHAQLRSRRDALSRVLRYIREHVDTRINLTEAAAAVHLSPNYLTHLLKKETGKTFVELVTARRMEKARELLSQTALRVTEIAEAVGFEDVAYFTRRFRQHFRLGPREYRNRTFTTG